ncbi:MAG: esterase-like activity of phytase family protein [Erythrobacter sp.]|jgi:cyclophilin family peptidyl-prolyl cis-trans isomerase|nr:esterase-like activity of phytase family protein [Erythrobacter sp.]
MTWSRLLLAFSLALGLAHPALAQEEIYPITAAIALDEADPANEAAGRLIYRGGLAIDPGEARIGGLSGLTWLDGELYAVADDGRWFVITPDEAEGRLLDLIRIRMGDLSDERGRKLRDKEDADAESIAIGAPGEWLVAFERNHRVWRYGSLEGAAAPFPTDADDLVAGAEPNKGLETFETYPGGAMLACGEWAEAGRANCVAVSDAGPEFFELTAPPELAEHGGVPVDAACVSNETCYLLLRSFKPGYGNRIAVVELTQQGSQTLGVLDAPLTRDNFEGLAVREQYGKRWLYLVSDDNFRNCAYTDEPATCQRTLLMKFEIDDPQAMPPPPPDAPEPDPQYATVPVVLETELGAITIALETERAPITAANFLRYVEEGRFDGTVFYRAMRLEREPQPNGLLQGGTQFDSKRILPPIAHEPTTVTGLSHTNGALSMAMGEPGSATGDFSIMLQDQTGLDAQPDAAEAVWRNGYAVFGYVVDGMDVVAAIHASPVDPDKGEGWMKGQMLAKPVKILEARRVKAAP